MATTEELVRNYEEAARQEAEVWERFHNETVHQDEDEVEARTADELAREYEEAMRQEAEVWEQIKGSQQAE